MGEMAVVGARTRELILYANIVCESLIHAFLYIVIYDFLFATTSTISMSVSRVQRHGSLVYLYVLLLTQWHRRGEGAKR